ncbi:S8 family peptidase [Gracilimonas mengyeensis]|uniref:Subtilase family protein n=1 Tax=Gracilimonas mengyeensis TaxID=1302730 RepID=A0A521AUQ3_9BACT|nr:S8 family peptidase [Gracilimonas mengyeensis]SMO38320.1 Subtilase family protein [Gracilimonas mengyeensis]
MNNFLKLASFSALMLILSSCAGSKTITDTETETNKGAESNAEAEAVTATETWHLAPANASPYLGTGVEKAYNKILADKSPQKKVVVAIIDSGTDIHHEDLQGKIWVNDDEIPGNNVDDDNNGYVDDIYGWNFIGGPDSTHVNKDTYEVTRLYAKLSERFEGVPVDSVAPENQEDYEYYLQIKEDFNKRVDKNNMEMMQISQFRQAIASAKQTLGVSSIDSLSMKELQMTENDSPQEQQAKQIIGAIKSQGASEKDIQDVEDYYEHVSGLAEYGLNPEFDPRHIVGDDYDDLSDRYYGNNDVVGPTADHGTHVAGIVGAIRNNDLGAQGIAGNVELMILRTVPDGDERDKDVANAIRYAAENGADIMNMSFGKGYSPQKEYVDAAMQYADSVGVLMVSGSGNGSENTDSTDTYPTRYYENGGKANNYLSVGASSWHSDSTLAANFSNYGKENVDLFAPGVDVYSTFPNNSYEPNSGTSMASPVVAGVAALIMSYYPELTATQVKEIILETVTEVDQVVYKPGNGEAVPFSQLSSSGGIINAYDAIQRAEELTN